MGTRTIHGRPSLVFLGILHEVADTAPNEALKYKDVPLDIQAGIVREGCRIKLVSFFLREVERCSVYRCPHIVVIERVLSEEVVFESPMDEGVKAGHKTVEGVATSWFRKAAFRDGLICLFKEGVCNVTLPFFINFYKLMLGRIVVVEVPQEV